MHTLILNFDSEVIFGTLYVCVHLYSYMVYIMYICIYITYIYNVYGEWGHIGYIIN